jgi:hypothetical protein
VQDECCCGEEKPEIALDTSNVMSYGSCALGAPISSGQLRRVRCIVETDSPLKPLDSGARQPVGFVRSNDVNAQTLFVGGQLLVRLPLLLTRGFTATKAYLWRYAWNRMPEAGEVGDYNEVEYARTHTHSRLPQLLT